MAIRSSRRWVLGALALAACAGAALAAYAVAPRSAVRASARLVTARPRDGSGDSVARVVDYEFPERFRENESAPVAVRFRDPACQGKPGEETRASGEAQLPAADLTVTLSGHGFQVAPREKRVTIRACSQRLVFEVVPERAGSHVLHFRFETGLGDAEVTPTRFEVPVASALFLPSEVLFKGSALLSAFTGLIGVGTLLSTVHGWGTKLRERFRRPAAS